MDVQTLPDSFYHWMLGAGFMLMLTGRVWQLMLLYANKSSYFPRDAQWKRYTFAFIGLLPSLGITIVLLIKYGLHNTLVGLNEAYNAVAIFGIVMWAIFLIHVVTIPGMLGFMAWFYFHPVKQTRRIA